MGALEAPGNGPAGAHIRGSGSAPLGNYRVRPETVSLEHKAVLLQSPVCTSERDLMNNFTAAVSPSETFPPRNPTISPWEWRNGSSLKLSVTVPINAERH